MVKRFCDEKENHVPHPQLGRVSQSPPAKRKPDHLGERRRRGKGDDAGEDWGTGRGAAVHGFGDPDAGDGAGGLPVGGAANAGLFAVVIYLAASVMSRAGACDLGAAAGWVRRAVAAAEKPCGAAFSA